MAHLIPERTLSKKVKAWRRIMKGWQLYTLLILPLAYLMIFKYVPMYGTVIAFKNFVAARGIWGSEWVGLVHFERFFHSYQFGRVFRNTLTLAAYELLVGFPLPIILALSLNYVRNAFFKKSIQMITYAPHFISVVVLVGITMQMLQPGTGAVNIVLGLFGMDSIHFMAIPEYFKTIYVLSGVWQNVGFASIIYLAALSGVDPTLHEAAVMDGASKLKRMWHVDIPGITPIIVVMFILAMGNFMEIGFEKVLLMQNPLNLRTSEIIDTYVFNIGLKGAVPQYSAAAAIGLFKNLIALFLLVTANRLARRSGTSLW
ncbi:ABC transporter permease subunit [Paenibacillus phyllosphaerae]